MGDNCAGCGTHTGTHWPTCPNTGARLDQPITRRTDGERAAYIQGFEAGIDACERHGTDVAREIARTAARATL